MSEPRGGERSAPAGSCAAGTGSASGPAPRDRRGVARRLALATVAAASAAAAVLGAGCLGGAHPEPPTARGEPDGSLALDAGAAFNPGADAGPAAGGDASAAPPGIDFGEGLDSDLAADARPGRALPALPWGPLPPPWLGAPAPRLPDGGVPAGDAAATDGTPGDGP